MKKLEILITQYNEPEEIVKELLDSIALQQGINLKKDVGVTIVNDCGIILSEELFKDYKFDIKYLKNEKNMGISYSRNKAFDNSESEYVMWCDADDMFYSSLGIYAIFEYMDEIDDYGRMGFDILAPQYLEESTNDNGTKVKYIIHKEDKALMHGKVYNRNFLVENNIRFDDDIRAHEDCYFNVIAFTSSWDVKEIDNCYYVWRNNKNSVTRKVNNFILETVEELMKSYNKIIEGLISRGYTKPAKDNVAVIMYRVYYEAQTSDFVGAPDRLKVLEDLIGDFWLKYKYLYERVALEDKIDLIKQMKIAYIERVPLEIITFDDWTKHLEKIKERKKK